MRKLAPLIDDARRSPSPDSELESSEREGLDLRKRFVGDVDLPESASFASCVIHWLLTVRIGQEPLLMESKRRFVLFPIQYHEVSLPSITS